MPRNVWGQEINEINEIFEVVTARALTQLSKYGWVSITSMEEALAATKLGFQNNNSMLSSQSDIDITW